MQRRDDDLWEWSVFWQSDQLQSCMPINESSDSNRLFSIWQDFFAALPVGARMLDLGTGNGSVATQAVSVSNDKAKQFSIHGVDLAEIDPSRFVTSVANLLQEITFHPQTPMEKLPFPDEHFDAITSQYAIEYSQTDKSLAEAMRVLRPQGNFRFLLHADDGVLKSRCELQRRQAETILDSDLFSLFADLLKKLFTAEAINTPEKIAAAEQSIAALAAVFDNLEQRFAADENRSLVENLFAAVRRLPDLRKSHTLETLLEVTEEIRDLLVAQSKRLQAMQHAALDEAAATELVERLHEIGVAEVKLERATASDDKSCIGYWLYGEKAASKT